MVHLVALDTALSMFTGVRNEAEQPCPPSPILSCVWHGQLQQLAAIEQLQLVERERDTRSCQEERPVANLQLLWLLFAVTE